MPFSFAKERKKAFSFRAFSFAKERRQGAALHIWPLALECYTSDPAHYASAPERYTSALECCKSAPERSFFLLQKKKASVPINGLNQYTIPTTVSNSTLVDDKCVLEPTTTNADTYLLVYCRSLYWEPDNDLRTTV